MTSDHPLTPEVQHDQRPVKDTSVDSVYAHSIAAQSRRIQAQPRFFDGVLNSAPTPLHSAYHTTGWFLASLGAVGAAGVAGYIAQHHDVLVTEVYECVSEGGDNMLSMLASASFEFTIGYPKEDDPWEVFDSAYGARLDFGNIEYRENNTLTRKMVWFKQKTRGGIVGKRCTVQINHHFIDAVVEKTTVLQDPVFSFLWHGEIWVTSNPVPACPPAIYDGISIPSAYEMFLESIRRRTSDSWWFPAFAKLRKILIKDSNRDYGGDRSLLSDRQHMWFAAHVTWGQWLLGLVPELDFIAATSGVLPRVAAVFAPCLTSLVGVNVAGIFGSIVMSINIYHRVY